MIILQAYFSHRDVDMDIIYSILRKSIWSHEKCKILSPVYTDIHQPLVPVVRNCNANYTKWILTRRRTFIHPSHCTYFQYSSYTVSMFTKLTPNETNVQGLSNIYALICIKVVSKSFYRIKIRLFQILFSVMTLDHLVRLKHLTLIHQRKMEKSLPTIIQTLLAPQVDCLYSPEWTIIWVEWAQCMS